MARLCGIAFLCFLLQCLAPQIVFAYIEVSLVLLFSNTTKYIKKQPKPLFVSYRCHRSLVFSFYLNFFLQRNFKCAFLITKLFLKNATLKNNHFSSRKNVPLFLFLVSICPTSQWALNSVTCLWLPFHIHQKFLRQSLNFGLFLFFLFSFVLFSFCCFSFLCFISFASHSDFVRIFF